MASKNDNQDVALDWLKSVGLPLTPENYRDLVGEVPDDQLPDELQS